MGYPNSNFSSSPLEGKSLRISLLGELRVVRNGIEIPLPASRKARALLAFLIETDRPHRRERLCEMFWDMPSDPRAALRWSLSKLRKIIDAPGHTRISADRERVSFDTSDIQIDVREAYSQLGKGLENLSFAELDVLEQRLDVVVLEGLDGAGDASFDAWLQSVRETVRSAHNRVIRTIAKHSESSAASMTKRGARWSEADPDPDMDAAAEYSMAVAGSKEGSTTFASRQMGRLLMPPMHDRAVALNQQQIGFCDTSDGVKIAYAALGSGPPLLKAANWLTHLEFDWTSPIWGQSFSEIARSRTLIRYDERGCGLSDWNVKELNFDAFVEDLEVVADKLALDRFPLLGISQGAAVSIEYAVRHPERVSALILIGSYAVGWSHIASPEERALREAVQTLTEVGWGTDNPAYRHIFSQTFMPNAGPEELEWFDELQRLTTSPLNAARFLNAFGLIDVRDQLAKVKVPTIVLHSKGDRRIPLEQARALAAGIPDAVFVPLNSENHVLVDYEPAWQVCMTAIQDFLQENGI